MNDWIKPLEENLWSLWSHFGNAPQGNLVDAPELMRYETPVAALPYNGIMRFRKTGDIDSFIGEQFLHFERRGKPFLLLTHPTMEPQDLGKRLEKRGFQEIEPLSGMAVRLDQLSAPGPAPAGVEIREVLDPSDWMALIEFVAWRWQVPEEWRSFLDGVARTMRVGEPEANVRVWMAWKNGEPVAKALVHEAAGAIGLYGVATKPEARGLGLGRTICLEALLGMDAGRGLPGILHSSPMAVSLYEKMGFHHVAPLHLYALPDGFHV